MTSSQASARAGMARKLAGLLPATPPQHRRVVKGQFGTKEHYQRRARRLSSLASGREAQGR